MKLVYHRRVQSDVSAVLDYYDDAGGPGLGDAFFDEFMAYVAVVVENPTRFHPVEGDLRRANLERFPYHFLYRISSDTIRIVVLRHHHRASRYGLKRK